MAKCEICGKTQSWGSKISVARSHVSERAGRTFQPNIRKVKVADEHGETRKACVCAKCLRSGKVNRA